MRERGWIFEEQIHLVLIDFFFSFLSHADTTQLDTVTPRSIPRHLPKTLDAFVMDGSPASFTIMLEAYASSRQDYFLMRKLVDKALSP